MTSWPWFWRALVCWPTLGLALGPALLGASDLSRAAHVGDLEAVGHLIRKGADVNFVNPNSPWRFTPLILAAKGGHARTVRLLTDHGAELNAADSTGKTALMWAAERGYEAVVEVLLEAGADPNFASDAGNRTALIFAILAGRKDMVRRLLDRGANPNTVYTRTGDTRPRTALHAARGLDGNDIAAILILAGARD